MIRPFRDEAERYGRYSLAAESMYDPLPMGSKRTGPDLARVGGRCSNDRHVAHMVDPPAVVPESIMPGCRFLPEREVKTSDIADHLRALAVARVPCTVEMIESAAADLQDRATTDADHDGLLSRYPKTVVGDLDSQPGRVSEMDALVAHLQSLGRMVDFTDIRTEDILQ